MCHICIIPVCVSVSVCFCECLCVCVLCHDVDNVVVPWPLSASALTIATIVRPFVFVSRALSSNKSAS